MSDANHKNGKGWWLWICLLLCLLGLVALAVKPGLRALKDRELREHGMTKGEGLFLKGVDFNFGERHLTPKLKNHPYLESLGLYSFETDPAELGRMPKLKSIFFNLPAGTDLSTIPKQFPRLTNFGAWPLSDTECESMKDWPQAWRNQITTFNTGEWYTSTAELENAGLTTKGVQAVIDTFPNLTRLRLKGTQLSGDDLVSVKLEQVILSGKGSQIVPLTKSEIGTLDLGANQLAAGALAPLAGSQVKYLGMSYAKVADDEVFVGELLKINGLEGVALNGTNISTNQLRRLCKEHPSLKHVYWFEMAAGKEQKDALKKLIADETGVELQ